jgi:SAM-dependent methyltransferase
MPVLSTKNYVPVVADILRQHRPSRILDAPSGSGWLRSMVDSECEIDGIDLYGKAPVGYRHFRAIDLDQGLPDDLGTYDAIVSCEGIEHIGNPELFLRSARALLKDGGTIVITTPNTWHPAARLQYVTRGFFPGFPCLVGRIQKGTHMHIAPWTFSHLYVYLTLAGFSDVRLHEVDEPKPRRAFEWPFGLLQKAYCARHLKKATNEEHRRFWTQLASPQSVYGRQLVVSAVNR